MPIAITYWVLMILLLLFGGLSTMYGTFIVSAQFVLIYLLMLVIGWKLFGSPVQ